MFGAGAPSNLNSGMMSGKYLLIDGISHRTLQCSAFEIVSEFCTLLRFIKVNETVNRQFSYAQPVVTT